METSLQHILELAQPFLERYGYLSIFGAVFVEGFGVPAPGQTFIIAGSALAADGKLEIVPVLVIAWVAAVLGDNLGYAIGRWGGHRLVLRYGRRIGVHEERLARAEAFFDTRGAWLVGVARFVDVLRQLNGVIAGTTGMRWWTFVGFNALGAALWVGVWGFGTYQLGPHIAALLGRFHRIEPWVIAAGVIGLAGLAYYLVRRRRAEP